MASVVTRKPDTQTKYVQQLTALDGWLAEIKRCAPTVENVTSDDDRDWIVARRRAGPSPKTIANQPGRLPQRCWRGLHLRSSPGIRHARLVIDYRTGLDGIERDQLEGFFDSWPAAPDAGALLRILRSSSFAVLACDGDHVVGFVNALSDGLLAVYVPLLEVRAPYRGRGIGSELVARVLSQFSDAYMVDAVCDPEAVPFYERLGMTRLAGMAHRNRQASILQPVR